MQLSIPLMLWFYGRGSAKKKSSDIDDHRAKKVGFINPATINAKIMRNVL
jgi:DhnA family fructose-bisphosphate aldolase class Ia